MLRLRPGVPRLVTLLMLPGLAAHWTAGVTPRQAVRLSRAWFGPVLDRLLPSVRVGPVLVDPGQVRLPPVAALGERQVLTYRSGPLSWRDDPILAATQSALLPDSAAVLREGWVRVDPSPPPEPEGSRMSRYDWPAARPRRDDPGQRRAWTAGREVGSSVEDIEASRQLRRLHEEAARVDPAAGVAALAPAGAGRNWLPIGPTTTLRGKTDSDPRVSGRIRDIQVSPDGQRLYVASALGGLWYSQDAGATWEPVGPFTATLDRRTIAPSSNTLACGAVHVRFAQPGTPDPERQDEVWLGTGEPDPLRTPNDIGVLANYGGIGILQATGPVGTTRATPNVDPWTRQAQPRPGPPPYPGLRGAGVFGFAADPADPRRLVAATTRGLHVHDPDAAAGADPWTVVTEPDLGRRGQVPGSARLVFTSVVWVPADPATNSPARLWVTIRRRGTPLTGLWRSDNGAAGPFVEVALTGVRDGTGEPAVRNLGLAAAPGDRDVLYVLGSGPAIWRVDGASTVRRVVEASCRASCTGPVPTPARTTPSRSRSTRTSRAGS